MIIFLVESDGLSPMAKSGVWSSIVWGKSHQENREHVIWCSSHVPGVAILANLGAPRKPQGARVRLLSMTLYGGPSPLLTEKSTFIEFSFLGVDMECYPCFAHQQLQLE